MYKLASTSELATRMNINLSPAGNGDVQQEIVQSLSINCTFLVVVGL